MARGIYINHVHTERLLVSYPTSCTYGAVIGKLSNIMYIRKYGAVIGKLSNIMYIRSGYWYRKLKTPQSGLMLIMVAGYMCI